MAQLNIADAWWTDPRRMLLAKLCGNDIFRADGIALQAWRTAQQFWKKDSSPIPLKIFKALEGFEALVQAGLAEIDAENVYICGTKEHFKWLLERKEAGKLGGNKSAQLRVANTKQTPSKRNPTPTSITTPKVISKKEPKKVSLGSENFTPEGVDQRRELLTFWLTEYQNKKGTDYPEPRSAKTNGQIKNLHARLGLVEAKRLMATYLQINKPYYVNRGHDLGTLQTDIAAVNSWGATPLKNIKDAKQFQIVKGEIENVSTTLHERIEIGRRIENSRNGGEVFESLPRPTLDRLPEKPSDPFEQEFFTGRGEDDFSSGCL